MKRAISLAIIVTLSLMGGAFGAACVGEEATYNPGPGPSDSGQDTSVPDVGSQGDAGPPAALEGLALWLDGADPKSVEVGTDSRVKLWKDKSSNHWDFYAPRAPFVAPTFVSGAMGSHSGLKFVRTNKEFLIGPSLFGKLTAGEAFVVCRTVRIIPQADPDAGEGGPPPEKHYGLWSFSSAGSYHPGGDTNLYDTFGQIAQPYVAGGLAGDLVQAHIFNVRSSTAEWMATINGREIAARRTNVTVEFRKDRTLLGATINGPNTGSDDFYNGEITELIVYQRPLTAEERSNIHRYLGTKWGITVKQPDGGAY